MIRNSPFSKLTRLLLPAAFLLFAAHCSLLTVLAQTTNATLSGVVEDQKGAVVPGVKITVTNPATGLERTVVTDDSGAYVVPLLPPATYTVTAEQTGFATVKFPNITLNVNDQRSLRIELKVGAVGGEVEVRADAVTVKTDVSVGTTIDRTFVGNLPLNGRSFQSLIFLTPGVVPTISSTATDAGQFSVNGQRANSNYVTVDGVSANIGVSTTAGGGSDFSQNAAGALPGFSSLGTTSNLVSIDALEEFKIQTSSYSAEFGRQPGGQVQLVTRSGGSDFHGTVFEYFRNEAFDANNWFANRAGLKRAPLRQNQFGGTFSGPVMLPRFGEGGKPFWSGRNKTFFFFSYEALRLRLPVTFNQFVPAVRLRQLAVAQVQPLLNAFPVPTGPEVTAGGMPLGVAPFVGNASSPSKLDATSIRIDHALTGKVSLFGRYNDSPSSSLNRILNSLTGTITRTRTLTLGSTSAFSPSLSNELRFNYSVNRGRQTLVMDTYGGAVPVDLSFLTSGYEGPGRRTGQIQFTVQGAGLLVGAGDPINSYQRQMNLVDSVSVIKSAHELKFGIDYRRLSPTFGPQAYRSQFFIQNSNVNNFVTNGNIIELIGANIATEPIFQNFSAFAQDNWKASPRLSLNFGIRWELNPPPHEANGISPVTVTGADNLATAKLASPNAPFYKTFHRAFGPRLGIAYELGKRPGRETVLRAGFGIYHDLGSGEAATLFSGFPFSAFKFLVNVPFPLTPAQAAPPPFPAATLPLGSTVSAINPNLQLPYTLEWNVAVERSLGRNQLVSVSYVAAAGRKLLTTQSLNNSFGTRPNPNFGTILYVTNGPTSDYKSLQAQFQRKLSRGLQAVINYMVACR